MEKLRSANKNVLGTYDTPPTWVSDESIPGKVLKLGLTTDVRLCGPCAASAQRENGFYGRHLPLLEAGAVFVKYGFLVERTVFVKWVDGTVQYQSINVMSNVLSGIVKAIPFDTISSLTPVGVSGLYLTTPSQQHRLDAADPHVRDLWLQALRSALEMRQLCMCMGVMCFRQSLIAIVASCAAYRTSSESEHRSKRSALSSLGNRVSEQ
ncbi:hypothetical protein DYB34_004319 [Aphanomyces astaci]|uniref:PH domain-containing protein n=1 Tax=Aphanomyces astaci TaxID=112090 RepID=A0A418BJS6_APHAT|nr:hypothetical protein DYB34_004319 [Aphanomyces astaci]